MRDDQDRDRSTGRPSADESEAAALGPLARLYPTADAATAEAARLAAERTMPKPTVHVISDVHGDDVKLRHVLNNASGTLRPLVESLFAGRKSEAEIRSLLTLIFYPGETLEAHAADLADPAARRDFAGRALSDLFEVVRALARRETLRRVVGLMPADYRELMVEMLHRPETDRGPDYFNAILDALTRHDRGLRLVRLTARLLRDLAVDELVLAGDCWDRGPRGDRVVDYLMKQPNVTFLWGNHDAAWLGACLGGEALIAHVLRISARYRQLSQLEEGYGITLQPLEHLVRTAYDDDPAESYSLKGDGLRPVELMRRLQKAAAIMQFKLEGQLIDRNPQYDLGARKLLHTIDAVAGTIVIDGKTYELKDRHFPTLDPADPYALSADERRCMDRLRQSFLASRRLWDHMTYLASRGSMYAIRDRHLIFHACLPCDAEGNFLPLVVDGRPLVGRAQFEAIDAAIARALRHPTDADRDLMWYLWCGALSPLFGKDRITTLENDLVADKSTHAETKNPYFALIHEPWFCDKVMAEFGVDPAHGLIVNGHVPVKIEQGESPLKRSGKAITIDGAFSQAYGDHGYTLVLEPDRTLLAKHHHFESVAAAVRDGVDIIPTVDEIRRWSPPRSVGDTERGAALARDATQLDHLIDAYSRNAIRAGGA